MTFRFDGFNHIVRLQRGELLIESLTKLVKEQNIGGAWVSGLGAARNAEVGYYELDKKEYVYKKLEGLLEVASLQGNIAWDGREPAIHLHGVFSDKDMRAFGGHVKELEVGGTLELLLHRWYQDKLLRFRDDDSGLKLLNL